MGRAPCCEKMGLKKGPWAPEEDRILISHINTYGHGNWRALPKLAGLLRCGKSCRLRWTNYLRPDIKRGNFTREEEETIIMLHEMLGNRWSAIAARLPGRTDNEIKNVWHTHLKKRLPQHKKQDKKRNPKQMDNSKSSNLDYSKKEQDPVMSTVPSNDHVKSESPESEFNDSNMPLSPPQCSTSSEISTFSTNDSSEHNNAATSTRIDMPVNIESSSPENIPALDEDFWSEVFSADNSSTEMASDFPAIGQLSFSSLMTSEALADGTSSSNMCDSMEFWYDLYAKAEDITEFLEL